MSVTNQAAFLDGKDKTLRIDATDLAKPGAGEIVVRNHALAINPVDWKIQDSGMFVQSWPHVLGQDSAGEVYDVGSDVTKFKKGDRVLAHATSLATGKNHHGSFQLFTVAPVATSAIIPNPISYKDASVLPLALDTAAHGLYSSQADGFLGLDYPSLTPKPSGKTLVIWGASSSVGALVVQLAAASGAKVIATASSHNHDFVRGLGATEVFDYSKSSVVQDVLKAVKSAGGEYVGLYDSISTAGTFKYTMDIAEQLGGGSVALVLPPPENVPAGIKIGNVFAVNPVTYPLWEKYITPALAEGKLKTVPEALVVGKGLGSLQKGLDTNKKGVSAKKVVIEL